MDLFRYLMTKNGHNYLKDDDLFSYKLAKGQGGTYAIFEGTTINANNTRRGKMKLSLKGNTSQTGTPTPDNPIPVNVVSGDNEVVVCGINVWDEEWEVGEINGSTGAKANTGNAIRSKNYIELDNLQTYYFYSPSGTIYQYDSSKTYIGALFGKANNTFTLASNCKYIMFATATAYGTTYNNDICINVSNASINGTYYPYQSTSYPINLPVENLLNNIATSGTWSNVTFTINEDKSITLNGLADSNNSITLDTISFESGETYTISGVTGFTDTTLQIFTASSSAFPTGSRLQCYNGAVTRTAQANENCDVRLFIYSGVQYDNVTIYPQIEKGSKANHYTPYGTTPIEMCDINDNRDKFIRNSGKNLIPFTNQDFTINNVRYYVQDGSLYLNGTSTGETSSKNQNFENNFSFTLPSGTYTISQKSTVGLYLFDSEGNNILSNPNYVLSNGTRIFTLTEQTQLFFGFYVYQKTFANINAEIMIEKGSSATSYEPYGNGDWYLEKKIGKVVLDGSENWTYRNDYSAFYINNTTSLGTIAPLSNYFKGITSGITSNDNAILFNTSTLFLLYHDLSGDTDALKTWLSTHNTTIYYVLNTPTYTKITGTLAEQLEAVWRAYSYNGQTNISQINNDLASNMEAEILVNE